jgi:X-Pro dipeptidyl-peptidase
VPAKIWWTQGPHGDRANSARQAEWRDTLNRFWTMHLFGVKNGAMDGPKAVIERENNQWVEYADWPVPGARDVTVRFAPANPNGIGQLGVRQSEPAVAEVIIDDAIFNANVLIAAPASPNRLVYQTAPLSAAVHVSGTPSVTLRLAFDKPAANVSAMLVDYKNGVAPFIVTRGWADPQNRESISKTTPVVPGTVYTMTFEFQPHDYIFAAGSKLGLALLSTDQLFTLRPPPGTRLTVHTAQSSLQLPVVGGDAAFRAATGGR